ncbi:outer membrane lipid asymmetry maintenance protein MlaD [Aestuariibius sp. HNIBRBA575]|uniref:outer membrane lipid asymmetry maintenance protein MlaD n=1 Tax=Aestuariibius sp. HNIBRBA575 TaxID=3233343 RepID=UPI0034A19C7F
MRENTTEVLTGAAILCVALAFLFYLTQAAGLSRSSEGYDLTASFRSAEGLSVGTDIRLAGVKIGSVTGLDLNVQTYRADATMTFQDGILIPDDSVVAVASEGLLGGTFVEISPGGSFENFAAGDEITNTQGAVSVIQLLVKFVSGGEEGA